MIGNILLHENHKHQSIGIAVREHKICKEQQGVMSVCVKGSLIFIVPSSLLVLMYFGTLF